jgi:hypothetical protein
MCVLKRIIAGIAGDVTPGAIGWQKILEETDSSRATNVGCRQFRKARSE